MNDGTNSNPKAEPFALAALFQSSLIFVAIGLAYFGLYDHDQPLSFAEIREKLPIALRWGILGVAPMLTILVLARSNWSAMKDMTEATNNLLRPLFAQFTFFEVLFVAVIAGIGEELLFRWAIQGGISHLVGDRLGLAAGLFVGSAVFGMCHWVNATYGVVTTLVGLYLGLMMVLTETWVAPAIAHGIYDLIAILFITDRLPVKLPAAAQTEKDL